jgi:hypothetical protein
MLSHPRSAKLRRLSRQKHQSSVPFSLIPFSGRPGGRSIFWTGSGTVRPGTTAHKSFTDSTLAHVSTLTEVCGVLKATTTNLALTCHPMIIGGGWLHNGGFSKGRPHPVRTAEQMTSSPRRRPSECVFQPQSVRTIPQCVKRKHDERVRARISYVVASWNRRPAGLGGVCKPALPHVRVHEGIQSPLIQ